MPQISKDQEPALGLVNPAIDNSVENTSQIGGLLDNEKLSDDMSFQLNINEIIGSIDEKSEL
jgi:hypothetical protein